jgi:hypothetical protein
VRFEIQWVSVFRIKYSGGEFRHSFLDGRNGWPDAEGLPCLANSLYKTERQTSLVNFVLTNYYCLRPCSNVHYKVLTSFWTKFKHYWQTKNLLFLVYVIYEQADYNRSRMTEGNKTATNRITSQPSDFEPGASSLSLKRPSLGLCVLCTAATPTPTPLGSLHSIRVSVSPYTYRLLQRCVSNYLFWNTRLETKSILVL